MTIIALHFLAVFAFIVFLYALEKIYLFIFPEKDDDQ